jgi:hypothetical protein
VRGHILIRTVWLGLFLLIGLGTLASFKLAFNASQPVAMINAVAFVSADADISTVGNSAVSDTMLKGDRLQITHLQPAVDLKPVAVEDAPLPPARAVTGAPRIISRHWHDPSDQKREQAAATKSKLKDSKKNWAQTCSRGQLLQTRTAGHVTSGFQHAYELCHQQLNPSLDS